MKSYHKREDHPKNATRICKRQCKVIWELPARPSWMTKDQYEAFPKEVEVRLVDVNVDHPGFRAECFTIATTMLCQVPNWKFRWLFLHLEASLVSLAVALSSRGQNDARLIRPKFLHQSVVTSAPRMIKTTQSKPRSGCRHSAARENSF